MSVDLKHERQQFLNKIKAESLNASQTVALQLSCGFDLHQTLNADPTHQKAAISKLDRLIQRERLKGLNKHWSYDINRHIALKQIRDRLLSLLASKTPLNLPANSTSK